MTADSLAVPQLRRLWSRTCGEPAATRAPPDPAQWAADRIAIYGLGLGLHDTLEFLNQRRPRFEEFEAWIVGRNAEARRPERIAWVNERIDRLSDRSPRAPTAEESLEPALDADDLRFWNENGYIVLKQAVSREAARAAELAVWQFTGRRPHDIDSWYNKSHGATIMVPLIHHPAFEANRRSPRIHSAYAQLLGTNDLVVTVDRGGFNPPERADWGFPGPNLHWDTSLALPVPLSIQGVLYLADTPMNQGAFCCIPGFNRTLETWLSALPPGTDPRMEILKHPSHCIAAEAGDMVLWQDTLPHGASPNRGTYPRIVQYIAMYPADRVDRRPWI